MTNFRTRWDGDEEAGKWLHLSPWVHGSHCLGLQLDKNIIMGPRGKNPSFSLIFNIKMLWKVQNRPGASSHHPPSRGDRPKQHLSCESNGRSCPRTRPTSGTAAGLGRARHPGWVRAPLARESLWPHHGRKHRVGMDHPCCVFCQFFTEQVIEGL